MEISGNVFYFGKSGGVLKSTNNGLNWSSYNVGSSAIFSIKNLNNKIFAATDQSIYRSTNNGLNWTTVYTSSGIKALEVFAYILLVARNGGLYKSVNDGANWSSTPLTNNLKSLATSSTAIAAGDASNKYISFSTDVGVSWTNSIINITKILSIIKSGSLLFAGSNSHGVYKSTDDGISWTQTSFSAYTSYSLAILSNKLFVASSDGIYISTNNGLNWSSTPTPGSLTTSLTTTVSSLIAGTGTGIYRSTDNGASWSLKLNGQNITSLASYNNNVFAGTSNGVFMSTNNGISWDASSPSYSVNCVAIIDNKVIAGTNNGLYLSTNNGILWTRTALDSIKVTSCAISGNNIFVGSFKNGFYFSSNTGNSWIIKNEGYTSNNYYPSINCLYLDSNFIFAGTEYLSIWRRQLNEIIINPQIKISLSILMEGMYFPVFNQMTRKDTIKVYLHSSISPYNKIDSASTPIDSVTNNGLFIFNNTTPGFYYIVAKHFNCIETWSKDGGEPLTNDGSTYNYDFTTAASQAYGNNLKRKGTKYGMISGDSNQDGFIDGSDFIQTENDAVNFRTGRFLPTDLNGDNFVDGSDRQIGDNNRSSVVITP